MLVKVIRTYRDKFSRQVVTVGTEFESDNARAKQLHQAGFVKYLNKAPEPSASKASTSKPKGKKKQADDGTAQQD